VTVAGRVAFAMLPHLAVIHSASAQAAADVNPPPVPMEPVMDDKPAPSKATFDLERVQQLLPHRYPFLMVDRIVDVDGDNSAVGIKAVTVNEPHFQGHVPGRPVMPGVLLIEGIAQTAGAICSAIIGPDAAGRPPLVYFMSVDQAKFRRPVVPGDVVEYHVKKLRHRGGVWKFAGEARVDGQKVAEAVVTAMVVD
jgi:3-hydroxyacyl-[acyl-carrier-protein] dehydratase